MSTLTGRKIANSYKNLLQVETSNTDLDTSLKNVQTGAGNNTPLQLSTDKINLNGTIQINGTTLSATAAELNAITDLTGTTGIVAVSAGNVNGRTIVVGSPLSITNANGTEGNPTINLASSGVSAATYGPMVNFTVDNFGRITDVTATTTISANAFIGGTLSGSALTVENNTSIGGNVVIEGTTNMKAVSATDVTFNNLTVGTKITTDTVTATTVETSILRATTASISDLTAGTLTFNNLSTTNLFAVSANVTRLFKDGESVATSAEVATLSATMATSIANRTSAITSINSVVTDLSATMAASITNKTAGIPAAFVSVNAVIINLSSTLATSIANVSALSKTNLDAITSINTVVGDLSSTLATSIGNRTSAITSINTVVGNLSSTLATSISNRTSAITSINTVITNLSTTLATSIANVDITSVSAFTVNALTVVSAVNGDLTITGNINADGGEIHDFEFGSMGFSNITGLIHSSLSTPTTQYSLLQSSIGKTYLNSAIGNTLDFRIGNTTYAKVDVGTFNVQSFADGGPILNLISNDHSDATDFHTEATIKFLADNSANEQTEYANIQLKTADVTDSTENGWIYFGTVHQGTLANSLAIGSSGSLHFLGTSGHDNHPHLQWNSTGGTSFDISLKTDVPTADRTITLPDASGEVIVNSGGQTMTSHLQFADNAQLRIGDGNDLVIRHDGNHSLIEDNGQGDLYIRASDNLNIQADNGSGGWQNAIQTQFTGTNAKVAFFNGGTQVFSTLPNGISIDVSGGIRFEGATADGSETFLQVTDPTADRTITLPDATGTVALTSDVATVSATMATSISNRTSAITSINSVITNLSSTFATSINNRTSAITSINTVITNLSSTLATSISNINITTVSDFTIKTSTGGILKLETSDVEVTVGDVLGAIEFKAPNEASGGDANLTAAAIVAESDSVFKSGQNRTDLVFKLGESAVATEKARITHTGNLELSNNLVFDGATNTTTLTATSTTTNRIIKLPDGKGTIHTTDYPEIITAYGPTTSPRTFKVTVQTPSGYYPYAGDGSGLKFHIDGMANPALELHGADQATASSEYIYRFDQSDSSNSGHPLRFYLEANKTTAYTVNVTTNGTPGSAGAYTQIAVDQETPKILYYQCSNHDYMGNYITAVNSNTFSNDGIRVGIFDGNNHDRLELFQNTDIKHTASGTGNSTTLTFNTASSNRTITFPDATGTVLTTGNSDTPSTTTASSDADFVLIDDGGTMKKITPSNLGIGGSGSITVQDEGSSLSTAATTLDFVGAGVVASGTGATKTITIAGGGSGITVQDEGSSLSTAATTLNFVGSGVTASGTGATKTITISGGGSGGGTTSETWGASLNGKLNMYTASKTIFIGSQDNATSATEPSVNATVSAVDGVVIGYNAGKDLTSGHSNIFIGRDAGESNTTGYGGTFIGYQAGKNVTTPHSNTIIGYAAGRYTTTGVSNTLIGYMAGTATYQSAGTMANNTAVGYVAGKDLTTGYKNSILGGYAGENISTGYHNSILGYEALKGATSGTFGNQYENVAVGYQALYSLGSGYRNSVLGTKALFESNSGIENVAIGFNAGYQATSSYNVIIGSQAGTSLTSGASHTFVGEKAGYHYATNSLSTAIGKFASWGQTGSNNTSVGYQAASGSSSTLNSGSYNVSVGYRAFYRSAGHSGSTHNCCVGYNAGAGIYTGDYNTFLGNNSYPYYNNSSYGVCIGFQARHNHTQCTSVGAYAGYSQYLQSDFTTLIGNYAGYDLDGGDHCTFVGYSAGYAGGTGSNNVGVGNYSVDALTSGFRNTGMGYGALSNITSGDDNAGLGYNAGEDFTTGSKNTFCGAYAGGNYSANYSGSNNTVIGYAATPSSTTVSNEITLGDSNVTSLRCQVQTISSLSDQRDKTAIEDLDLGLDFIKAMRPVKFAWNRRDGKWHGKKEVGFIAQELHEVEMDFNSTDRTRLVSYENPSKLEARPMNTYPILVKAIQELSAKVDSLQARITELEGA